MDFGALFDWDGVIVDSSRLHEESWELLAREVGRPLPPGHFKRSFGMKNEAIIPSLFRWDVADGEVRRLSRRKEALYRELVVQRGIEPLPGVREFLARLRAAGIPSAIASSTHRENIDLSLGAMGLAGFFTGIVTAEDVSHGKPHPEPFLLAAKRLGRQPERCVVFEDAFVGLDSGRAAGARVVAVTTTHPRAALAAHGAHRVVDRLDEIDVAELAAWFV
jgi:beta-phosphoglucomutase family hydrolase